MLAFYFGNYLQMIAMDHKSMSHIESSIYINNKKLTKVTIFTLTVGSSGGGAALRIVSGLGCN